MGRVYHHAGFNAFLAVAFMLAVTTSVFAEVVIDFDFTDTEGFDNNYQFIPETSPGAGDGTQFGALPFQNGFIGHSGGGGDPPTVNANPQSVWVVDTAASGYNGASGTASVYNNWIGMAHTNPISNLQVGETVRTRLVYKEHLGDGNNINKLSRFYIGYRTRDFSESCCGESGGAPFINPGSQDAFTDRVDMWMQTGYNVYPNPGLNDGQEVLEGSYQSTVNNNAINDPFETGGPETETTVSLPAPSVGLAPFGVSGPADFETDWLEIVYEVTKLEVVDPLTDWHWEVDFSIDNLDDAEPAVTFNDKLQFNTTAYNASEWFPSLRSGDVANDFTEPHSDSVITVDRYTVEVDRLVAPVTTDWVGATINDPPDGDVDGVDREFWERYYGVNENADADGDFDSDGRDFLKWQQDHTGPLSTPAAGAVPEPTGIALLALGLLSAGLTRRVKR